MSNFRNISKEGTVLRTLHFKATVQRCTCTTIQEDLANPKTGIKPVHPKGPLCKRTMMVVQGVMARLQSSRNACNLVSTFVVATPFHDQMPDCADTSLLEQAIETVYAFRTDLRAGRGSTQYSAEDSGSLD